MTHAIKLRVTLWLDKLTRPSGVEGRRIER
jgi:hypothetical protein